MKRLVIVLFLLLIAVPAGAQQQNEPFDCPAAAQHIRTTVECAYISVPEDHNQPDGSQIKLAIATLHSFAETPAPDPVIFLQGGPGGAAILPTLNNLSMMQLMAPVLQTRDVILLDQRGIGLSQPRLGCPELDSLYMQLIRGLQSTEANVQGLEMLLACHDRFVEQGVNLAAYDTRQNAADVATIVEVLGYEQVNLYGASYGTRLGLTVMRDYPERIRSSILNAVLPYNIDLAREDAANMQHSLYTIFQACQESVLCNWAYPDLESVFFKVYTDLNADPLRVVIEADDGRIFDFELDGRKLMATMFYMMYTPRTISAIPSIIYGLQERDASQYSDFVSIPKRSDLEASGSEIMSLSVMCNDFLPFMNRAETNLAVREPFQNMGIFSSPRFDLCPGWQTTAPDPLGDVAVRSNIPTLILTGSMDHVTPAAWGERTASTLANAYVYNFPYQSHGVIGSCADTILTAFVDDPMTPPPSGCIAQERPVQFLISSAGTRPWVGYSLLLVGSVALGLSGYTSVNAWKRRHFPWLHSLRAMGWLPPALTGLTLILLLLLPETDVTNLDPLKKARLVETIVPLVIAIQAAFVLPPEDEPALELLMTYPRSLSWLILERLAVIWLMQGVIALIGTMASVAIMGDSAIVVALVRWIPPAMLLSGLSLNAALRSRKAVFGVLVAGLVWFVMAFLGEAFLPGQPTTYPLNYIQPLVWPLHAYLQPGDLLSRDYLLNRIFVFVVGLNLVALAVAYVRDHERLLLGKSALTAKPERMVAS